jgi:hypothetical protein
MTEFITDRRSFLTERYEENVHPVFRRWNGRFWAAISP